jgi:hypothetical protein
VLKKVEQEERRTLGTHRDWKVRTRREQMKRVVFGVIVAAVTASMCLAEYKFEYTEGKECRIGGDIRVRLTHWDRDVVFPNGGPEPGPAVEYLRVRERLYGCFELDETTELQLRLVNRWHHFSSHFFEPNNQAAPYDPVGLSGNTWNFPDEVILDRAFLDFQDVMDSDWSLRLGRQDVVLGNGLVVLEGTPYDQGRTIYFDGAVATYKTEEHTLRLMALYNNYKDTFTLINDQNRRLRRADTFVTGAYYTRPLNECHSVDLYYLYANLDDDRDTTAERGHPANENWELHIVGGRVFGELSPQVAYSVEAAQQMGEYMDAADLNGRMVDARLTLKAADGTAMDPVLGLELTYMSGDDLNSADEVEGWHPAFAEYPIWREELLPIMTNGNWTNLNQLRSELKLALSERVSFTGAGAALVADYGENNTGGGDNIGYLLSAFLDVKVTDELKVALEAAEFRPGNNFADGHSCEWLRFQAVYTF